jgi:hypothetical protein
VKAGSIRHLLGSCTLRGRRLMPGRAIACSRSRSCRTDWSTGDRSTATNARPIRPGNSCGRRTWEPRALRNAPAPFQSASRALRRPRPTFRSDGDVGPVANAPVR